MVSTHDLYAYADSLSDDDLEQLEYVLNQVREKRQRAALRQVQASFVVGRR